MQLCTWKCFDRAAVRPLRGRLFPRLRRGVASLFVRDPLRSLRFALLASLHALSRIPPTRSTRVRLPRSQVAAKQRRRLPLPLFPPFELPPLSPPLPLLLRCGRARETGRYTLKVIGAIPFDGGDEVERD